MYKIVAVLGMWAISFWTLAVCQTENHKQFDFWLGDWDVYTQQGQLAGQNSITKQLNGCVLQEVYRTPSNYAGQSINIYDAASGQWHQTWVDNGGFLLSLNGSFVNGSMILEGSGKDQKGAPIKHRITWTLAADQSVRQHWQSSSDDGTNWTTVFDGKYVKQKQ